jgi:predicted enzyme related to lactoylglutathione lyase
MEKIDRMSTSQCKFVWYDLVTSDSNAAATFYETVVGWKISDAGMPDRSYAILSTDTSMVGGLMALSKEACELGASSAWMGYIGVADVDLYAKRLFRAGGKIERVPEDIPGIGRYAVVADPQGAVFILFTPSNSEKPVPVKPEDFGRIAWHELAATDTESAFSFYSSLFGWTRPENVSTRESANRQAFATEGILLGAVDRSNKPAAYWRYFFNVKDIARAVDRVTQGGGHITQGPSSIPGGRLMAHCTDPQGALFALVEMEQQSNKR